MLTIKDLFDLNDTIAAPLFEGKTYAWEVLGELSDYIKTLGATLSLEEYDHPSEDVWIAKDAKVFPSAYLGGPCIIDHEAEIRHCAFIRGSAIVGKKAVVGNSVELKNVVLFDYVQTPHYNYVGDSILGGHAHMGRLHHLQRQERQDPRRHPGRGGADAHPAEKDRRDLGQLR